MHVIAFFSFDSRSISALLYQRMYANHKLQSIDLVFFGKFFAHTHTLKFLFLICHATEKNK